RSGRAGLLRGGGASPGTPRRRGRDRGGGRDGLRADLLGLFPGWTGRARRPPPGRVRGQDRAQPARVGRAGRAVVGGGLGERARPAHRDVPSRSPAPPALPPPPLPHPPPPPAPRPPPPPHPPPAPPTPH